MAIEVITAAVFANALRKPFQDIFDLAKGKSKDKLKKFTQIAALDKVYNRTLSVGTIRTISSRQPISIREIYYPARIKTDESTIPIDRTEDLSNGANQHIVITGTVGQGKSVFLKYLCIREIETGSGLPIFIELRHTSEFKSLKNLIQDQLLYLGFTGEIDDELLGLLFSRRLVTLFLDGYDEVKKSMAEAVRHEIHQLASQNASLRIIVSSRPTAISQQLDRLFGFNYLEINPLTPKDFDPFLEKIGTSSETRARLINAIKGSHTEIRALLTTPLMLTLVVTACGTRPALPETLPDFYQALFGVMVATHDETKPGYIRDKASKLGNNQLEQLFKAFCFIAKEEAGTTSLTSTEFNSCAAKAIEISDVPCSIENLKSDLVDVVCLMAKDGLNTAFIHKSIQEYYAAAFIADIDDDDIVKQIYSRIRNGWYLDWIQELKFLKELDSHRLKKYYYIPSLISILTEFNHSSTKRNGTSIADIKKGVRAFKPTLGLNSERDELSISLNVSTISRYGARAYIFDVFRGITEICDSALSASTTHSEELMLDVDDNLIKIISRQTDLSRAIRQKIQQNLHLLYALKETLEAEVSQRRDRLLSLVATKKRRLN